MSVVNRDLRYAFMGSGAFAARCLELLSVWRMPSWIVTASPKLGGRGKQTIFTAVANVVAENDFFNKIDMVCTPSASTDDNVLALKRRKPVDFVFVVDFGQMIKEPLLAWDAPVGCLNIHPSLLPLYRGAAPVQRALMDGVSETGVTIFKLARGMDSGPVLVQEKMTVEPEDDMESLLDRAAVVGTGAFIDFVTHTPIDRWTFYPQDEENATSAPKIQREEECIDWRHSAISIAGKIRALSPKPGAWTTIRGKRLRILKAGIGQGAVGGTPGELLGMQGSLPVVAAGTGSLVLQCVQMEGKKIQPASDWRNGIRIEPGECLG